MNPATMVRSWQKLLPDLEDNNLQGFPNEEITKSDILDMVCDIRNSENTDEGKVDQLNNGERVMCVK
jgi:hypothetical protein